MVVPPPEFVVDNLLPVGLTVLAGKQKVGKSWLLLDLALAITSGNPFLGIPTQQGDVLYLALENHLPRLFDRLSKLAPHGSWGGDHLTFCTAMPNLAEGGVEVIRKWLEEAPNPRLVMLDVFGRAAPENKSKRDEYSHITQVLGELQALAFEYGISLTIVHHVRKGGVEEGGDPFDGVMGSTAMTSNADATLMLERRRMGDEGCLALTGRDVSERRVALRFDSETFRWHLDEVESGAAPALSPEEGKVLDAIRKGMSKPTEIAKYLNKGRTAVYAQLNTLCEQGLIEKASEGVYTVVSSDLELSEYPQNNGAAHDMFLDLI